jgi:hypothetical protein
MFFGKRYGRRSPQWRSRLGWEATVNTYLKEIACVLVDINGI